MKLKSFTGQLLQPIDMKFKTFTGQLLQSIAMKLTVLIRKHFQCKGHLQIVSDT